MPLDNNHDWVPKGSIDLSKESEYIDTALSMYVIFNERTKKHTLFSDRAKKIVHTMLHKTDFKASHRDLGCFAICMLFYSQCIKVDMHNHKGNNEAIQKDNQKLNHYQKLYRYFFDQFGQTVSPDHRKKYNRMLATHAPLNKLLLV